jgi:hypothetical protein
MKALKLDLGLADVLFDNRKRTGGISWEAQQKTKKAMQA